MLCLRTLRSALVALSISSVLASAPIALIPSAAARNVTTDLRVSVEVDRGGYEPGEIGDIEVTVTNSGVQAARRVSTVISLPKGFQYVARASSEECDLLGRSIICFTPEVSDDVSYVITFVTPSSFTTGPFTARTRTTTRETSLANNMVLFSLSAQSNSSSHSSSSSASTSSSSSSATANAGTANLSIVKAASPSISFNQNIEFKLYVTNFGPGIAREVNITDSHNGFLSLQSGPLTDARCRSTTNGTTVCAIDDLRPGQTQQLSLLYRQVPGFQSYCGTSVAFPALVTSQNDPLTGNNLSSPIIKFNCENKNVGADLELKKTLEYPLGPLVSGGKLSYNFSITNNGPEIATSIELRDPVPQGFSFVPQGSSQNCAEVNGFVVCKLASLSQHAQRGGIGILYQLPALPCDSRLVDTQAKVTAAQADPYLDNNVSRTGLSQQIECPVPSKQADLSVQQAKVVYEPVGYNVKTSVSVVYKNNGPDSVSGTITFMLPQGISLYTIPGEPSCTMGANRLVTCPFSSIASGASAVLRYGIQLPTLACTPTNLNTRYSIESSAFDPNTSNNALQSSLLLDCFDGTTLDVQTAYSQQTLEPDQVLKLTITARNPNDSPARPLSLIQSVIPDGLGFNQKESTQGCRIVKGYSSLPQVACDRPAGVGPNSTDTIVIAYDVQSGQACRSQIQLPGFSLNATTPRMSGGSSMTNAIVRVNCPPVSSDTLRQTKLNSAVSQQLLYGVSSDPIAVVSAVPSSSDLEVKTAAVVFYNSSKIHSYLESVSLAITGSDSVPPTLTLTKDACTGTVYENSQAFCTSVTGSPLIMKSGQERTFVVRANLRANVPDTQYIFVKSINIGTRGSSQNQSIQQNQLEVASPYHIIVLSKISSILNAHPSADGTAIPLGASRNIAQFQFNTHANSNSAVGPATWNLDGIIFNIESNNIAIRSTSFRLYNKNSPGTVAACTPFDYLNARITSEQILGAYFVRCSNLGNLSLNIGSSQSLTLVLEADVTNVKLNPSLASYLQVSLEQFNNPFSNEMSVVDSHITWIDSVTRSISNWIQSSANVIRSTRFQDY